MGHESRAAFGRGANLGKDAWRSIVRQLVAAGFLNLDIEGFGGLKLTADGGALLRGEKAFAKERALSDLSEGEVSLLADLKQLRQQLARERGVPAYVIFSDRSLEDMARRQPRSPKEFADIHGVGEVKLRDLAESFLGIIAGA